MIYWFIGQPGSGKTTLATEFCDALNYAIRLDGDDLRKIFGSGYGPQQLTKEWRIDQTKILQNLVAYLDDQGFDVVISTVNPYREVREEFKKNYDVEEIYVHTTNIRGREHLHVIDFEPPLDNFIDMDTTDKEVDVCVDEICGKLHL